MYVYIPHLRNDTEFRAILFDGYTDYSWVKLVYLRDDTEFRAILFDHLVNGARSIRADKNRPHVPPRRARK